MNTSLETINFRQMEIFFCTVEQGSFTKAAAMLHMTQSAVSKSIAKMERELGIRLFRRHYRDIYITDAGKELYHQWKEHSEAMSRAYETIRHTQQQAENRLRIGAANTTKVETYFKNIIESFRQKHEDITLELDCDSINRLIEKLAGRQLDLIFVPDFMKYKLEALEMPWKWAVMDDAQVLLPANHPLADTEITLKKLQNEKLVVLDSSAYPENKQYIEEIFAEEGLLPQISRFSFPTPESIEHFYQEGNGILLTDKYFKFYDNSGHMIAKSLKEVKNGILCSWNPSGMSANVEIFLNSI